MSSGYPSAEKLRLLLTSPHEFALFLQNRFSRQPGISYSWYKSQIEGHAKVFNHAIEIFQQGNFGTVDEFCAVCGGVYSDEVQIVKDYMSFVLSCVSPEYTFEQSEYHSFIRHLFNPDRRTLREDVSILTFNYDPYLEFLLINALEVRTREKSSGRAPLPDAAVISGLCPFGQPLAGRAGFCHLKLHGSIGLLYTNPNGQEPTATGLNKILKKPSNPAEFLSGLFAARPKTHGPICFPWEINFTDGKFSGPLITETGWKKFDNFNEVFTDIWQRAREEVQRAKKISFVGISMHDFLLPGLKYMFEGKSDDYWLIVANKDMELDVREISPSRGGEPRKLFHPTSSVSRIRTALTGLCSGRPFQNVTECAVPTFETFIRTEMEPFYNY
jgi:hypothetical protein